MVACGALVGPERSSVRRKPDAAIAVAQRFADFLFRGDKWVKSEFLPVHRGTMPADECAGKRAGKCS